MNMVLQNRSKILQNRILQNHSEITECIAKIARISPILASKIARLIELAVGHSYCNINDDVFYFHFDVDFVVTCREYILGVFERNSDSNKNLARIADLCMELVRTSLKNWQTQNPSIAINVHWTKARDAKNAKRFCSNDFTLLFAIQQALQKVFIDEQGQLAVETGAADPSRAHPKKVVGSFLAAASNLSKTLDEHRSALKELRLRVTNVVKSYDTAIKMAYNRDTPEYRKLCSLHSEQARIDLSNLRRYAMEIIAEVEKMGAACPEPARPGLVRPRHTMVEGTRQRKT